MEVRGCGKGLESHLDGHWHRVIVTDAWTLSFVPKVKHRYEPLSEVCKPVAHTKNKFTPPLR